MKTPKTNDSEGPEPGQDDEKSSILSLRQSVLRADDAYRCCKGGKMQAEKIVLDLKDVVMEIATANYKRDRTQGPEYGPLPETGGLRPAQAQPIIKLIPLAPSMLEWVRFIWVGIGLAGHWSIFKRFEEGGKKKEESHPMGEGWSKIWPRDAAMMQLALDVCQEVIQKTKPDCMKCVEKKRLGQNTPRRHRTFVGGGTIMRRESGGSKP